MKCKQAADIIKKIVLFQIVRLYHDYSYASQYILIRHVSNQNRISIDVELEIKNWLTLKWHADAMLIMLHYQMIITTKTSQLSSRWAKNNKHLHSIVQCDQNFLSFSTHVSWQLLFSCLIPNRWNIFSWCDPCLMLVVLDSFVWVFIFVDTQHACFLT